MRAVRGHGDRVTAATTTFGGARGAKVALLATSLFWLVVWGVVGWRAGVDPRALAAYALVLVGYVASGLLGFAPARRLRYVGGVGALVLALAVAIPTFLDTRLLA